MFSDLVSPFTITLSASAIAFLGVQAITDNAQAQSDKRLRKMLLSDARQRAIQPCTVIIELDRRADTIFPLLQSLGDQKYAELQVVVIVKQTAGSRASTQLRAYNRSNIKPKLNMRVIRYKKGMSREIVAFKYATGELVLWLTPSMRLSKDFFITASLRFFDYSTEALSLRRQLKLDQTLRSGFQAIDAVWRDYASIIQKPQRSLRYAQPGVIYRRNSNIKYPVVRHESSLSIMQVPPVQVTRYGAIASTLSLTAVLTVGLTMSLEYAQYMFGFAVIGQTLLCTIWLINSQLYSIPNKLTLIALAPFQLAALPVLAISDAIWRKLSGRKATAQQA